MADERTVRADFGGHVAQDKGISDIEYLQRVRAAAQAYRKSDQIAGRADFVEALQQA